MPVLFVPGSGPIVIPEPPLGSIDVLSIPQPQRLGIEYIDPDGRLWNFMDLDMAEGFICTDIRGISGTPVSLSTIPLVRGGALAQTLTYQPRSVGMGVFVMSVNNADGQDDYLSLLDDLTVAFTTIRDDAPAPGTLIISRPDGTQRQLAVFCTAGQDQPDDGPDLSGLLYTSYAFTLQAPDPFFYDADTTDLVFGNPITTSAFLYFDFEDGTDGWTGGSAAGTGTNAVAQSTAFFSTGANSLVLNPDGTSVTPEARSPITPVSPGQVISFTMDVWGSVSLSDYEIGVRAYDGNPTFVTSSYTAAFALVANTKTTKSFTYTVPTDGSIQNVAIVFRIFNSTPASTRHMYADNILVNNNVGFLPLLPISLQGASSFGDVIITNDGQADAYPVWTITGPGTPTVNNNTTGRSWSWDVALNPGQVIVVDTMPGQQSAIDQGTGLSVWSDLVTNSPRDLWPLIRGDNDVNISVSGASAATSVAMSYLRRWLRS